MNKSFSVVDQPNNSFDEDFLGIDTHAQALSNFIRQCSTPLTIGIQGEWGSGKTSLLNSISYKLGTDEYKIITINAWEHALLSKPEETLIKIVNEIISDLTSELKASDQLKKKVSNNLEQIAKGALRIASASAAGAATSQVVDELLTSNQNIINDLKKQLEEGTREIIEKQKKYKKIIIYVDDLDRIDPPDAVAVLELLKNIFDIKNCVFVLAIDYQVVVKGLEKKFGKRNNENEWEFKAFFDKIIQLPFMMPIGQYDVGKYIKSLLEEVDYLEVGQGSKDNYDIAKMLTQIIDLSIGGNPRSLKRLVNSLSLIQMFMNVRGNKELETTSNMNISQRDLLMFSIVCMQIKYPDIYDVLTQHANFKEWDERLALEITDGKEKTDDFPHFEEDLKNNSEKEEFDEVWEQAIYRICYVKERYRAKADNISRLFTFIDKEILKEKDGEDTIQSIKDIINETSITSVATKEFSKDKKPYERELYDGIDGYLNKQKEQVKNYYNKNIDFLIKQLDNKIKELFKDDPLVHFKYSKTQGLTVYVKKHAMEIDGLRFAKIKFGFTESKLAKENYLDRRHFVSIDIAKSISKKGLEKVSYEDPSLYKFYQSQSKHAVHMYELEITDIKDFDEIKKFLIESKESVSKFGFATDLNAIKGGHNKNKVLELKLNDFKKRLKDYPGYNNILKD
jgi:ABC-type dipeptide/oligopeptide/nickel transport system ATPase subunit